MKQMLMRWLLVPTLVIAGYLAYWYLQSPVPAGVYPARVGGVYFTDDLATEYELPVIWIRPHPWAELPPELSYAALRDSKGRGHTLTGGFRPALLGYHTAERPAWRLPRAVHATLSLPIPPGDEFTLAAVEWELTGQPRVRYENGPLRIVRIKPGPRPITFGGWWGFQTPPDGDYVVDTTGYYIFLQGSGKVYDFISTLPGSRGTPEGLLYREGKEETSGYYSPHKTYQPVTFPLELNGWITLFYPLSDEELARRKDTYYYLRPAVLAGSSSGPALIPYPGSERGLGARRGWRSWVDFYIYNGTVAAH